YLQGNIEGGEYFDWYYATDADRQSQTRTTITDGSGKPWVFRNKDVRAWWQNSHYDRPAGVEGSTATAWAAQSKPIWFTEFGCPAIDKGANQPNVFYDPKSSESQVPYFSSAARDDVIQRAYLTAHLDYWAPSVGNNPTSSVYSAPMIDTTRMFAWAWDARPFPDFPLRNDVWSDAPNFDFGHWLGGRLGRVPLGALIKQLCATVGVSTVDTSGLDGINLLVGGFVIDTISSVRSMLEPLMRAYQFDAFESGGSLCFVRRGLGVVASLVEADLVLNDDGDISFQTTRAQETELPRSVKLTFLDEDAEYRTATAEGRKLAGSSVDVVDLAVPVVLSQGYARGLAELALQNAWISRETVTAALPPSFLRLDPGDVVNLDLGGQSRRLQITGMDTGIDRQAEMKSHGEAEIYRVAQHSGRQGRIGAVTVYGPTVLAFLDIPLLPGGETEPQAPRLAAHQLPWPGTVSVYRSVPGGGGYTRITDIDTPAVMGELTTDLASGPVWRWDHANSPTIQLYSGELSSASQDNVLNGANVLAVENAQGGWEIFQFTDANLLGARLYQISGLLRGQRGSEAQMRDPVSAGARVVLLDREALEILGLAGEQRLLPLDYRCGPGAHDHSHFTYTQTTRSFVGVGLKPYAPVHLSAIKASGGDVTFGWVRRTRIGGDIWDNADVPLAEENETFEVDIVDAGAVKRTLAATTTQAIYTSVQQTADFGAPQSAYTIRISQISAAFGRGEPKEVTLNV
ncbi:MAG: baseplate multidomain protein megatron, partial [Alphaproteobacteria bacterium]